MSDVSKSPPKEWKVGTISRGWSVRLRVRGDGRVDVIAVPPIRVDDDKR